MISLTLFLCVNVQATLYPLIKFTLITLDKNAEYRVDEVEGLLQDPDFHADRPTLVYMHGFVESIRSGSVIAISQALAQRGSHNFVLVDYSHYSGPDYLTTFLILPLLSRDVGNALNRLVQAGLSRDTLWLVGHSMGGQMTGLTSRALNFKLKRITALDPAKPGYDVPGTLSLNRDDAELVDVIHTDAQPLGLGFLFRCGHVDFWPNGGSFQPGCDQVSLLDKVPCSHQRSWEFFVETVKNESSMPAVLCGSWSDFLAGNCPPSDENVVNLGYAPAPAGVQGSFFLITQDRRPFGLGRRGLVPRAP